MKIIFNGYNCRLEASRYPAEFGGGTALYLLDAETGEPVAVCTVNLHPVQPPDGHVFIKDWSENEGICQCLIDAGVIEHTGHFEPAGFVQADLCKLLINPEDLK